MTIPHYYPVLFNLEGRRVVVIGGGDVATEKVEQLVPTGASIIVIAPDLSETISEFTRNDEVHWVARRYRPGDLLGAYLVVAATNEPNTNTAVWEEAELRSIPVNSVDDIPHCSYIVPSVHRSGPLTIAISSGGTAPTVAVRARQALAERYDDKHGEYLYLLNEYRDRVKANIPTFNERRDLWYRIVDDGVEEIYRQEGVDAARVYIDSYITAAEDEIRVNETLDYIRTELATADRPAMTLGMQLGGMVLLHLIRKVRPDVPVIFVDTGYHFPETLSFRDEVAQNWELDLRVVSSRESVIEHESKRGILHLVDTTACCALRKVIPAHGAMEDHDLWLSSVRRTQTAERKVFTRSQDFPLETGGSIRRASPLLDWTWDEIERYAAANSVPRHPLYDQGYTSIGCAPCTSPTFGTDDNRAGRWDGDRVECGLNVLAGT